MGIDFKVESKNNPEWNKQQTTNGNCYCKTAWANLNWTIIFDMIGFNPALIYDNDPNYWETSQLNTVLINLKKLRNKDEQYTYLFPGYEQESIQMIKI